MQTDQPALSETDDRLMAFVREVTETLLAGKRHSTPGLGTFSTCARKATAERAACRIAMFRPSAELRAYATGDAAPSVAGPHADVVTLIIEAMRSEPGAVVPRLGRLAAVPVAGKKPRLIFHGDEALNGALIRS